MVFQFACERERRKYGLAFRLVLSNAGVYQAVL